MSRWAHCAVLSRNIAVELDTSDPETTQCSLVDASAGCSPVVHYCSTRSLPSQVFSCCLRAVFDAPQLLDFSAIRRGRRRLRGGIRIDIWMSDDNAIIRRQRFVPIAQPQHKKRKGRTESCDSLQPRHGTVELIIASAASSSTLLIRAHHSSIRIDPSVFLQQFSSIPLASALCRRIACYYKL